MVLSATLTCKKSVCLNSKPKGNYPFNVRGFLICTQMLENGIFPKLVFETVVKANAKT